MADLELFQQYLTLSEQLVKAASKDEVAECARLLALNLAHYELKFGSLPLDEILAATEAIEPNDEQVELLVRGMENMVGVLGGVIQGFEPKPTH